MIIFLYGQDTYRSRQKLKEIVEEYKKRHQSGLSFIKIDLSKQEFSDFKQAIETVSMFDEKKLIIVENIFQEEILDYLQRRKLDNDKDNIIIFWAEETDSKNELFKFLKKKAKVQEFKLLQPYKLKEWIKKYVKEQDGDIESQAVEKLAGYAGSDLWRMSNEIDKLVLYKKQDTRSKIQTEDIDKLVKPEIDVNIFNIVDALGQKNKKRALKLVHDYFKKGEDEGYLLNRFVYQFRNLIKIRDLLGRGTPINLLANKAGLHQFVAQKTSQQVKNFTFEELKKIYQKLFEIDLGVKTGKVDIRAALELFVAKL